jgi:hypothetical protein
VALNSLETAFHQGCSFHVPKRSFGVNTFVKTHWKDFEKKFEIVTGSRTAMIQGRAEVLVVPWCCFELAHSHHQENIRAAPISPYSIV